MEHCDVLSDCGFVKPIATFTLEDKVAAVHSITLHHVILQCKAELDQICNGIQDAGILKALRSNYDLYRAFFSLHGRERLTAGIKYFKTFLNNTGCNDITFFLPESIRSLFDTKFSERGTNDYMKEQNTYMCFLDYLEEIESMLKYFVQINHNLLPYNNCIGQETGREESSEESML